MVFDISVWMETSSSSTCLNRSYEHAVQTHCGGSADVGGGSTVRMFSCVVMPMVIKAQSIRGVIRFLLLVSYLYGEDRRNATEVETSASS